MSNNLKYIGAAAFTTCTSLENIVIPNSVECIGRNAFSSCSALTNIIFENPFSWNRERIYYNKPNNVVTEVAYSENLYVMDNPAENVNMMVNSDDYRWIRYE